MDQQQPNLSKRRDFQLNNDQLFEVRTLYPSFRCGYTKKLKASYCVTWQGRLRSIAMVNWAGKTVVVYKMEEGSMLSLHCINVEEQTGTAAWTKTNKKLFTATWVELPVSVHTGLKSTKITCHVCCTWWELCIAEVLLFLVGCFIELSWTDNIHFKLW